jgi:hypothetical protein
LKGFDVYYSIQSPSLFLLQELHHDWVSSIPINRYTKQLQRLISFELPMKTIV